MKQLNDPKLLPTTQKFWSVWDAFLLHVLVDSRLCGTLSKNLFSKIPYSRALLAGIFSLSIVYLNCYPLPQVSVASFFSFPNVFEEFHYSLLIPLREFRVRWNKRNPSSWLLLRVLREVKRDRHKFLRTRFSLLLLEPEPMSRMGTGKLWRGDGAKASQSITNVSYLVSVLVLLIKHSHGCSKPQTGYFSRVVIQLIRHVFVFFFFFFFCQNF